MKLSVLSSTAWYDNKWESHPQNLVDNCLITNARPNKDEKGCCFHSDRQPNTPKITFKLEEVAKISTVRILQRGFVDPQNTDKSR